MSTDTQDDQTGLPVNPAPYVPPPPANQMVYVVMKEGINLDSMYSAYWISGRMKTESRSTALGAAAYTLSGTLAEEYKF